MDGKVVLITGGASGIGLAIAREFLENGAKVAIADLEVPNLDPTLWIQTDVTVETQLVEAFAQTVQKFGHLDVVINNAGISNEATWEKMMEINLTAVIRGTYLAMKTYLPKYKSGPEAVIVNIASLMGFEPSCIVPVYTATKHGVVGLGRALGTPHYYQKYQVKILTMCPGMVPTGLFKGSAEEKMALPHLLKEEMKRFGARNQPAQWVAQWVLKMVEKGENGSVWGVENGEEGYEVVFPPRKDLQRCLEQ